MKRLKSRNGEARDVALAFDRPRRRFTADDAPEPTLERPDGELSKALRDFWGKTPPASEGDDHA